MNRYLLILWGSVYSSDAGGKRTARLSPEQIQENTKHWNAWMEGLGKQGVLDGGEPLGADARVIKGSRKIVTDGPYTEAKEAISGYVILKADSIEKATEISKGCPHLEVDGTVEVRPIQAM